MIIFIPNYVYRRYLIIHAFNCNAKTNHHGNGANKSVWGITQQYTFKVFEEIKTEVVMREFDPEGYVNQIQYIFYFVFVYLPYGVTKLPEGTIENGTESFCDQIGITRVETYHRYISIWW